MVWGAGQAGSTRFPAIEIRPRAPTNRLGSPSTSLNGTGQSDAVIRPRIERTATTDDISSSTAALDSSRQDTALRSSPSKRPRTSTTGAPSGTRERRQHKCSICSQAFARAEHLIRHERSHRKERPFSCVHCNATFTRKDLVKRHLTRSHPELGAADKAATAESAGDDDAAVAGQDGSGISPNQMALPQLGLQPQSSPFDSETIHNHEEFAHLPDNMGDTVSGHPMDGNALDHYDFESLLRDMNGNQVLHTPSMMAGILADEANGGLQFSFESPPLNQGPPDSGTIEPGAPFAGGPGTDVDPDPDIPDTDPAHFIYSLMPDSVQSSFGLSDGKRRLIVQDAEAVFSFARVPDTFRVPSCMAMERYITAFFDAFLVHAPCIHVPTFTTESAQPSLILAMAALGAQYHEEKDVAMLLHRAARLSILNQMEKTSFTAKGRPTWILQSLFFTMAFGVWRSNFDAVQESLAFQSNLGHIVRYVSYPGAKWVDDNQDPSLSWEEWIDLESAKRTKFVIYTFFNDLTLAYNVPPVITNSEINMDLPCDERLWTANCTASWSKRRNLSSASFQDTLRSLMSASDTNSLRCSTFGCHVVLSALSQQIWQSRQSSSPSENLPGLAKFQAALRDWQVMATKAEPPAESSGSNLESGALSRDSMNLLRLTHVMLALDTSKVKTVICRQDAQGIAQAMRSHCSGVLRSEIASTAALFAIHAFRRIVKAGVNVVTRRWSLELSPQTYSSWFDGCEC